jgi:hypothetical protein
VPANRRAAQLQQGTCETIATAVRQHLPASGYREFVLWALSTDNPRRSDYLQMTGLTQLVTMNMTLLGGLIEADAWPTVRGHLELMNAYQFFETITDNVAMGLGSPTLTGPAVERLEVVTALNRAMLQALTPRHSEPAVLLLSGAPRQAARRASAFDLSLVTAKYADMAEEYARHQIHVGAEPDVPDIEYGLWAALVANVETCRSVAEALDATPVGALVRDGLLSRYRAVDRSLRGQSLSRMELAMLGAHTILVIPTLAYGMGVLAIAGATIPELQAVLADGMLADVLFDASLLVRLQNDVGTRLLTMPPLEQRALIQRLNRRAVDRQKVDAYDAMTLLAEEAEHEIALTRVHKDILKEEFNVVLWHARRAADAGSALSAFADSLDYMSVLYAHHMIRLQNGLKALDERLGDRRMTTVIERFVRFHERMYSHRFTERTGEYAI